MAHLAATKVEASLLYNVARHTASSLPIGGEYRAGPSPQFWGRGSLASSVHVGIRRWSKHRPYERWLLVGGGDASTHATKKGLLSGRPEGAVMQYLDFEVAIKHDLGADYWASISSPAGEAYMTIRLPIQHLILPSSQRLPAPPGDSARPLRPLVEP